ncbi:site-2 protease family protein [Rhodobacteraceae bacterium LMO-12]|nr:site-2 protease family protein [Rhodobacteraceae bacterium LMO-JJ12]
MLQTGPIILRFQGIFGVPVEIGQTLAFLVLILGGVSLSAGADPIWLAIMLAMIFAIIYLHELGHAWACRVQGIDVRRIVLHGGGGFCEQELPATPHQQEFIVAMGPLVNLALWAVTTLVTDWVWDNGLGGGYLSHYLSLFSWLNLMFFAFNILPVLPLDGGRLLQLILQRFLPRATAMRVSGGVGLVVAILWWPGLVWLWLSTGWLLLFIPSIWLHYRLMRGELEI